MAAFHYLRQHQLYRGQLLLKQYVILHSQRGTENNPGTVSSSLEQGRTSVAILQGSIAAVLDNLAGNTNTISQPQDIFVSLDIPIDMNVSDTPKTKIWSQEYVEFGLLLNNKRAFQFSSMSFQWHSIINWANLSLHWSQIKSQSTSIQLICGSQLTNFFVGVYTQKYPLQAPALMKYGDIVKDLAARGYNWRYYDENFRYL